jgi:hypothetical protein
VRNEAPVVERNHQIAASESKRNSLKGRSDCEAEIELLNAFLRRIIEEKNRFRFQDNAELTIRNSR